MICEDCGREMEIAEDVVTGMEFWFCPGCHISMIECKLGKKCPICELLAEHKQKLKMGGGGDERNQQKSSE